MSPQMRERLTVSLSIVALVLLLLDEYSRGGFVDRPLTLGASRVVAWQIMASATMAILLARIAQLAARQELLGARRAAWIESVIFLCFNLVLFARDGSARFVDWGYVFNAHRAQLVGAGLLTRFLLIALLYIRLKPSVTADRRG